MYETQVLITESMESFTQKKFVLIQKIFQNSYRTNMLFVDSALLRCFVTLRVFVVLKMEAVNSSETLVTTGNYTIRKYTINIFIAVRSLNLIYILHS
jgi:hypothetical protein